jgi:hypothetical protein
MHPMKMENIDYTLSESSTSLSKISYRETRYFTSIGRDLRLAEQNNPKILGIETAKPGSP